MTLHPRHRRSASTFLSDRPSYPSAKPDTDLRRLFAGSKWNAPGTAGFPVRAASGEWMIPVIIDLPYAMLASLEAAAQSDETGDLIRAALVAAGHGTPDDIEGVRSDRFATPAERDEIAGTTQPPAA